MNPTASVAPAPAARSPSPADPLTAAQLHPGPLDVALGFAYGPAAGDAIVTATQVPSTPLAALERVIASHLERGRCYVSFSGGLDSSLVLAVATAQARRLGVPDPVPLTWRFDATATQAGETPWQEAVVRELSLADWQRLEAGDDLDWTGPVAAGLLRRHGLLYPANSFLHAPLAELARGASLLTGIGGDQVLGGWAGRELADLLARRRPPVAADLRRVGKAVLPGGVRARLAAGLRPVEPRGWLTVAAQARHNRLWAAERTGDPVRWDAHLRWRMARRDLVLSRASLDRLGCAHGARIVAPLLDPSVVAALARAGGRWGAGGRAATIARWFPAALPAAVAARTDKARFGQVFWRHHSSALAQELAAGDELADSEFISAAGLRATWSTGALAPRTELLLQQHWLARERAREPASRR